MRTPEMVRPYCQTGRRTPDYASMFYSIPGNFCRPWDLRLLGCLPCSRPGWPTRPFGCRIDATLARSATNLQSGLGGPSSCIVGVREREPPERSARANTAGFTSRDARARRCAEIDRRDAVLKFALGQHKLMKMTSISEPGEL